ncbi:MAG: hypothetical protein PWQ77_1482 [Kosmotogales bacterium]|nr:hypothetical protein [Kosmotogales bacterium]
MNIKNKNIFIACIIIIIITLVTILALFLFFNFRNFTIESAKEEELKIFKREYESVLDGYRNYSKFVYDNVINDDSILEILYDANKNREKIDFYRDELFNVLNEIYEYISEDDFRHLHFHLPDGTSFLRMHRPSNYGDSLFDVRESVRISNEDKVYIEGFEEGRISTGYRFVYPLEYNGEHIGSVEISISMAAILKSLSELFCEIHQFIIKKEVVDEKVFDEELSNYVTSTISRDFYYDVEIEEEIENIDSLCIQFLESKKVNQELRANIDDDLEKGKEFSRVVNISNKDYLISFLPMNNFKNETEAYIISYSISDAVKHDQEYFLMLIVFLIILYLSLIIIIFLLWRSKTKFLNISSTDPLTNVNNRNGFFEGLRYLHEKALKNKYDLYFIIFDIDHFKDINDKYGHLTGDKVLKNLSEIINKHIRKTDFFGRWGGDEFVLAISNVSNEIIIGIIEKLSIIVSRYDFGIDENLTLSIGVAKLAQDESIDDLLKKADEALYEAKKAGRNDIKYSI